MAVKKQPRKEDIDSAEKLNKALDPYEYSKSGMVNHVIDRPEFTGIARTVRCYKNFGHSNFQILTLYIEKDKVVKADVSDPYVSFECIQKFEYWNYLSILNLNNRWKEGGTLDR